MNVLQKVDLTHREQSKYEFLRDMFGNPLEKTMKAYPDNQDVLDALNMYVSEQLSVLDGDNYDIKNSYSVLVSRYEYVKENNIGDIRLWLPDYINQDVLTADIYENEIINNADICGGLKGLYTKYSKGW